MHPKPRDHVTRVRMRGGAITLALYSRCPRPGTPASLASPAPSLAEEGAGDARLPAFWVCVWPITTVIH